MTIDARQAAERLVALLGRGAAIPTLSPEAWDALVEEAFRHRVAQLVYHRVRAETAPVPAPTLARLRDFYARSALSTALNLRELSTVVGLLAERDIAVVALKGACLALDVYAEPALRSMADLDILVRRDALAIAERALLDAGWQSAPGTGEQERATNYHHLPKLRRARGATVEIHWTVERPTSPFRLDIDGLWQRARPASRYAPLLSPAPEDLLLHLSLHLSYHHRFERMVLKQLCDIAAILERHGERIDWELFARLADESGAGPFVHCTMRLACELLDVPVPPDALRALASARDEDELVRSARNFIFTPRQELPSGYTQLAHRRSVTQRLKLVIESLFPGRSVITSLHGLPAGSRRWLLYAALRPIDLVARRGRIGAQILFRSRALQPALRRESDRRRIYRWIDEADAAVDGRRAPRD